MRKKGGNTIKPPRVTLRYLLDCIMISPFDVESQTLPFTLVFDVKQSDGMEGFYTRISDARTERVADPREWRRKKFVVRIA